MNARFVAAMARREKAQHQPLRHIDMRPHPCAHRSWLTKVAQWATPERADWIVAAICIAGLWFVVEGWLLGMALEALR